MYRIALLPVILLVFSCSTNPGKENQIFNGKDLTGWTSSNLHYWTVEDGAIVGRLSDTLATNEFLWSDIPVKDFYLELDVLMTPASANNGIQIRSAKNAEGHAKGYQADIGWIDTMNFWGMLYDEEGRGLLDTTGNAGRAVKNNEWNRYEVLAVGNKIWIAINGVIGAAVEDSGGDTSGLIALQMHAGPPQTIKYKIKKLIHHPRIELAGLKEKRIERLVEETSCDYRTETLKLNRNQSSLTAEYVDRNYASPTADKNLFSELKLKYFICTKLLKRVSKLLPNEPDSLKSRFTT